MDSTAGPFSSSSAEGEPKLLSGVVTAEVAVMNRIGVSLAADSAVTIGREADKIYTSADKLFQLVSGAPVGVMVFGNADFMGMPWETIIKSYRRQLSKRFDRIDDYAKDVLSYLTNNHDLFPDEFRKSQANELILALFYHLRSGLGEKLDEEAKKKRKGLSEASIASIVSAAINERIKVIRSHEMIEGLPADHENAIRSMIKMR